jgi:5-methylcytosine-specific restriction endonuclease McrA
MPDKIPFSRTVPKTTWTAPVDSTEKDKEADAFYSSTTWARFRKSYLTQNPICLRCADGLVVPAVICHHRIERLQDPSLAYSRDNIEGLCWMHHNKEHAQRRKATRI